MFTFGMVQSCPSEVANELKRLTVRDRTLYAELRALEPASLKPSYRAARFIYLNRHCFNGLYRTNKAGQFNVPYGGDKCGSLPDEELLVQCSAALQSCELVTSDFQQVIDKTLPGDFVYMDPPFRITERRTFRTYDAASFSDDDLRHLRAWMQAVATKRITFLVSYGASSEAEFLRDGFKSIEVTVRRSIAARSSARMPAQEVLITNGPIPEKLTSLCRST